MRTSSEKIGNGLAKMRVEIEPAELQSEYARAVQRISGKARIPGFRPGKAPRSVVESMFGKSAIITEALDHLVPEAYDRAIREESLDPIDQPELDLSEDVDFYKPVVFTATVPLRPTVELGDIESISLTKVRATVEDHEIEKVLADLQQSRAELKPVEGRTLQEGDVGEARLSIVSGEIEKAEDEPVNFLVGKNWLPAGFNSKVMGMETGDVRVFDLDIPDDYYDEELRGKFASFTTELISIRAPEVPELTDELADSVSDFKTVEELRADVRKRVLERKQNTADVEVRKAALETAVTRSRFEIPDVLVKSHAEEILKGMTNYITSRGVALDTYLGSVEKTQEQWKEEALVQALDDLKRTVTLVEYAEQQNIEVTESEIAEEVAAVVEGYPESERGNVSKAHESVEMKSRLEGRIRDRKALEALVAAIEVTEEEPEVDTSDLEVSDESEVKAESPDPDLISESV